MQCKYNYTLTWAAIVAIMASVLLSFLGTGA